MSNWHRLIDDPRTWEAVDMLLLPLTHDDKGKEKEVRTVRGCLCENDVFPLLTHVAHIPSAWASMCGLDKTAENEEIERRRLVNLIRTTAAEMRTSRWMSGYRLSGVETNHNGEPVASFINVSSYMGKQTIPMWELLDDIASKIDDTQSIQEQDRDSYSKYYSRSITKKRNRLHEFTVREIFAVVDDLAQPKQRPITAMALLANAALSLHGDDEIKPNSFSKL